MTHTKLFMRRLAYVPWLLTIGLVLGWNGEAVADTPDPLPPGHSKVLTHVHATDPYLHVTYGVKAGTAGTADDTVYVSWSTSISKNFGKDKNDTNTRGNGSDATSYTLSLYAGENPYEQSALAGAGSPLRFTSKLTGNPADNIQYTGDNDGSTVAHDEIRSDILIVDLETTKGFYWVRMEVVVPFGDAANHATDTDTRNAFFAKQIAVEPDYILSVEPSTVREDVNRTVDFAVTVKVRADTTLKKDTSVPLQLSSLTGLNSRYLIELPKMTIRDGQKSAEGIIKFTPISDTSADEDLLVNIKTIGAPNADGSDDIRLIDTNKKSTAINLSFDYAKLTKNDGSTDITVTATLNGRTLEDHVSFSLVIDDTFAGSAQRDVDYSATLNTLTIRRRQESGQAKITIRPRNEGTGYIRIAPGAATNGTRTPAISVSVNPSSIEITSGPDKALKGLDAMPSSVREDAESKAITLEVSLQNALQTDETVVFTISDAIEDLTFDDVDPDPADRDVDYRAQVQPLVIPKGETKGTTTLTVSPIDNRIEDGPRAFVVNATVGGKTYPTGILITDDDTTSDSITLEVSPDEITEIDGSTAVTVTGTLNGKVFKDNVTVSLIISDDVDGDNKVDDDAATRDLDYTANLSPLVIPGGSVSGTTTITITPTPDDNTKEGDEKIHVKSSGEPTARADDGVDEKLTVAGATITLKDTLQAGTPTTPTDPTKLVFAAADSVAAQEYTAGTAITDLVLPEATGGTAPLTYFVSTLPAGLSFNPATRTISGTPTQATTAAANIFYTVVDSTNASSALSFSITVNEPVVPPPSTDAELTVTPSSVREDAGQTQIELTVSLKEAKDAAETVTFTLVAPSQGVKATRDVDYAARLEGSPVTIPAGATVGKATLTLTPTNNTQEDSLRALGVQAAFSSGATLVQDIKIVDDETASTAITLSVSPQTISEESGATTVTVTATWDGKALSENKAVTVTFDSGSTATRDVDYTVESFSPWIEIAAGSTTGSMQFTLRPTPDKETEGNETIKLTGSINDGLMGDDAVIILTDPVVPPAEPDDSALAFVAKVENQTYTAGTAIDPLVLPPASGGKGALTYVVSSLPAGLSFDWATRTISGTPSAATNGPTLVIYTVVDEDSKTALLLFFVTVEAPAAPAAPAFAADTVIDNQEYTEGTAITPLVLPEAMGGTAPLTYTVSSLPAGLSFDSATRTIEGTPTAATDGALPVVYTVVDGDGKSAVLLFSITVNAPQSVPPAFAADAVIANQEYTEGTAITPLVLPEASGGKGALTYTVSSLPAGLSFNSATRTISGTPSAATDGALPVVYQVSDESGLSAVLTFSITVNKKLTIDLSDLFGSGKIVPTDAPNGATIREFVVGQRVDGLVLPAGTGGSAPLTYSLSPALPAGLSFDPATRTIAGTPQAASETVYTYTVTDANGASASLMLQVLPAAFSLAANFPNPFNPATTIQYALPTAADVELTVYNVVGQVVRTLVAEHQGAGRYTVEWNATDDRGHSVSAGLYLYRLQAGGEFAEVKKMLLLK